MGNVVSLVLCQSDQPSPEDEDDAVWLSGTNGLPLFWLSLLAERDLSGAWEGDVRARSADPEDYADGLPPIRVSWTAAGTMLARAEARVQQRVPALASMFAEWAVALPSIAEAAAIREIRFYLGDYANFCDDADDLLRELRMRILVWHGDDEVVLPSLDSVENDLTGLDCTIGIAFPRPMPEWRSDREQRQHGRSTSVVQRRWEKVAGWGMALLCAATVLAAMALGQCLYGMTGLWLGGVVAISFSFLQPGGGWAAIGADAATPLDMTSVRNRRGYAGDALFCTIPG